MDPDPNVIHYRAEAFDEEIYGTFISALEHKVWAGSKAGA